MPFVCDNCKWNYEHACHDPRRPNVTWEMECNEFEWRTGPDQVSSPFDSERVGYYRREHKHKQYEHNWWRRLFKRG